MLTLHSVVGDCVCVRLVVITVKESGIFARAGLVVVFKQQLFPFDNFPLAIDAISVSLCENAALSSDAEQIVPAHRELREAKEE